MVCIGLKQKSKVIIWRYFIHVTTTVHQQTDKGRVCAASLTTTEYMSPSAGVQQARAKSVDEQNKTKQKDFLVKIRRKISILFSLKGVWQKCS